MLSDKLWRLQRLLKRNREPNGSLIISADPAEDLDELLAELAARAEKLEKQARPQLPADSELPANVIVLPVAGNRRAGTADAPGGAA